VGVSQIFIIGFIFHIMQLLTLMYKSLLTTVFLKLFSEVEPFAAILIAHRTHGHTRNLQGENREI